VTLQPEADRFLRAAVKTGLRLQRTEAVGTDNKEGSSGVQTLQRIKASLRKRTSKRNRTCDS
jgi:hypothetical protein